jgi:hypothetical protein
VSGDIRQFVDQIEKLTDDRHTGRVASDKLSQYAQALQGMFSATVSGQEASEVQRQIAQGTPQIVSRATSELARMFQQQLGQVALSSQGLSHFVGTLSGTSARTPASVSGGMVLQEPLDPQNAIAYARRLKGQTPETPKQQPQVTPPQQGTPDSEPYGLQPNWSPKYSWKRELARRQHEAEARRRQQEAAIGGIYPGQTPSEAAGLKSANERLAERQRYQDLMSSVKASFKSMWEPKRPKTTVGQDIAGLSWEERFARLEKTGKLLSEERVQQREQLHNLPTKQQRILSSESEEQRQREREGAGQGTGLAGIRKLFSGGSAGSTIVGKFSDAVTGATKSLAGTAGLMVAAYKLSLSLSRLGLSIGEGLLRPGQDRLEEARHLGRYSSTIAVEEARTDYTKRLQDFKLAQDTAGSTKDLARSQRELIRAWTPWKSFFTNTTNELLMAGNYIAASLMRLGNPDQMGEDPGGHTRVWSTFVDKAMAGSEKKRKEKEDKDKAAGVFKPKPLANVLGELGAGFGAKPLDPIGVIGGLARNMLGQLQEAHQRQAGARFGRGVGGAAPAALGAPAAGQAQPPGAGKPGDQDGVFGANVPPPRSYRQAMIDKMKAMEKSRREAYSRRVHHPMSEAQEEHRRAQAQKRLARIEDQEQRRLANEGFHQAMRDRQRERRVGNRPINQRPGEDDAFHRRFRDNVRRMEGQRQPEAPAEEEEQGVGGD